MPHRRIIIEVFGSTEEFAQQEVDRVIKFLRTNEYGQSSAFVDQHSYGLDFDDSLHNQAGSGTIGAQLNLDFDYNANRIRRL